MDRKQRLMSHIRTAKANLAVLHHLAEKSGDQEMIDAVNQHHRSLDLARADAVEVLELGDDPDIAALSGGEDKPPKEDGPGGN